MKNVSFKPFIDALATAVEGEEKNANAQLSAVDHMYRKVFEVQDRIRAVDYVLQQNGMADGADRKEWLDDLCSHLPRYVEAKEWIKDADKDDKRTTAYREKRSTMRAAENMARRIVKCIAALHKEKNSEKDVSIRRNGKELQFIQEGEVTYGPISMVERMAPKRQRDTDGHDAGISLGKAASAVSSAIASGKKMSKEASANVEAIVIAYLGEHFPNENGTGLDTKALADWYNAQSVKDDEGKAEGKPAEPMKPSKIKAA